MLILSFFTSGCNIFKGIEKSINPETSEDFIEIANAALAKGDYIKAEEYFDRAIKDNFINDDVCRGKAECIAGREGYNVINVLNTLQNLNTPPHDKAQIMFKLNKYNYNYNKIYQSAEWMSRVKSLSNSDRITYSFLSILYAVKIIIKKYDTNNNKKLDEYDRIDFTTGDDNHKTWPTIYEELINSNNSVVSLDKAFINLAKGFNDQKSENWNFISPISSQRLEGQYTQANRKTIQALQDLMEKLITLNNYYSSNNLASFTKGIIELDGIE